MTRCVPECRVSRMRDHPDLRVRQAGLVLGDGGRVDDRGLGAVPQQLSRVGTA